MNYWIAHHSKSEALAGKADTAELLGQKERSIRLYGEAATWEEKALNALSEADLPRTASITVTSAAYLYLKGENFHSGKTIAEKWIDNPHLQPWAKDELSNILETIELQQGATSNV